MVVGAVGVVGDLAQVLVHKPEAARVITPHLSMVVQVVLVAQQKVSIVPPGPVCSMAAGVAGVVGVVVLLVVVEEPKPELEVVPILPLKMAAQAVLGQLLNLPYATPMHASYVAQLVVVKEAGPSINMTNYQVVNPLATPKVSLSPVELSIILVHSMSW